MTGWKRRAMPVVWLALLGSALPLASCKKGSAPVIVDPGDQIGDRAAVVGQTFTLDIFASDADGDSLSFDFRAAGVEGIDQTAMMTVAPDGHGVFTFTPNANQVGSHLFDFIVSDGTFDTILPITIEVRGASGSGAAPIFRKPLGGGTVLDLEANDCTSFEIIIDDPDSTEVELTQLPPSIDGAELDASSNGLEGDWSWCPDREQRNGASQYNLILSADDGEHQTTKDFIVVLRAPSGEGCPGEAPIIGHEASDFSTLSELKITAQVSDDKGLKNAPLVFYSFEDPRNGDEIMFDQLQVAEMELTEGTPVAGTWVGHVPNPTVQSGEGSTATLYYIIEAKDDDDTEGDCDHRTDNPVNGMHVVTVTNNGQADGGSLCDPCSADVQCGSDSDLCAPVGGSDRCTTACGSGCPTGYVCETVTSVDGVAADQCVPEDGSCGGNGGRDTPCNDDSGEDDDNPQQATAQGYVDNTSYNAKLCPDDPDWYLVRLTERASIIADLEGDNPPDMDLELVDADQISITSSESASSSEILEGECLEPGDYFVVVSMYQVGAKEGAYTISFDVDAAACTTSDACCQTSGSAGCDGDSAIETCTCNADAFCCSTGWDSICVSKAINVCGLQCEPNDSSGDCCSANGTPGCEYDAMESCACIFNDTCCSGAVWTQSCVDTVNTNCGGCAEPGP